MSLMYQLLTCDSRVTYNMTQRPSVWQLAWEISLQKHYMSFTIALVWVHINANARYISYNQSLPIWVISPNWTSEHNSPCFTEYMHQNILTWISHRGSVLLSHTAIAAYGYTRQKPHNHTAYVVFLKHYCKIIIHPITSMLCIFF